MEFIKIGKVRCAHGIKGELKISVEEKFIDSLWESEAIFLEMRGNKTPYFVEELREGAAIMIKLENVDTRTASEQVGQPDIYLRREDIDLTDAEIDEDASLEYEHLLGYTLHETDLGEVGIIKLIEAYPQQEMATVSLGDKTVLIPLLPVWIVEINPEQKTVTMNLPDGILDL
jgi:16S rRNA processing protein RimM